MATAFEEEQEQVEERAHGPSPVEIANNSPAQIAKPLYRRPAVLVVGAVVVLIALVLGIRYWLYARSHESTDDAFIEGHIIQISPKVSGYVARVYVRSNQEVKAGDLLVELDARDYQVKFQQARAALEAARAKENERQSHTSDDGRKHPAGQGDSSSGASRNRVIARRCWQFGKQSESSELGCVGCTGEPRTGRRAGESRRS
jgi:biotin carboxyl carrier protein